VHRALVSAHGWGRDGLSLEEIETLDATAKHISETERRSMAAERDTADRYLASYLADRVGGQFTGRISGIARFGAFVKLDETGADGLLPMRAIGNEYFHFDAESQTLMGAESGLTIGIGDRVTVKLAEAVPVTGGLVLDLVEIDGRQLPTTRGRRGKSGGPMRRKAGQAAKKRSTLRKKTPSRRGGR
jgi:ribonuclease R